MALGGSPVADRALEPGADESDPSAGPDSSPERPLMVLTGVSKIYGAGEIAVHALREVDFKLELGDYLAIIGSSGSGKSTLMNIIGCLDQPTHGSYWLDGIDVG